jgi:hypothetical protein
LQPKLIRISTWLNRQLISKLSRTFSGDRHFVSWLLRWNGRLRHFLVDVVQDHSVASRVIYMRIFIYLCIFLNLISTICFPPQELKGKKSNLCRAKVHLCGHARGRHFAKNSKELKYEHLIQNGWVVLSAKVHLKIWRESWKLQSCRRHASQAPGDGRL